MGALYNFSRLINKYKSEFKAVTLSDGHYNDAGDFVKGDESEKTIHGAVIAFKESKVHRSEGTLTTQDRRLFTLEPIAQALKGAKAICDGNVYSIEDASDNNKFTGCYAYTLKWISAFKEGE